MGHGFFGVRLAEVPALRRRAGPIPEGWAAPAPSLLRNSDEQTIAGLCAVFTAIESMGLPRHRYEGWGVVAASRFLGRANLARALQSFLAEGVWGTSPHLIPHFALHSASGTISLGLGLHGPNLGVGGGLHAAAEGFLTALTWLSSGSVPGVWLVLSGWSPELVPDRGGGPPTASECQALAIALERPGPSRGRLTFQASLGGEAQAASAPLTWSRLTGTCWREGSRSPDDCDRSARAATNRFSRRAERPRMRHMNRDEPVWITGVGAATPLGFELDEIERSLLAGRSGVSLVTRFPTDDYPSRIAAQLGEIPRHPGCDSREFSARPRLEQLAHWCAEKALRDAGLWGRHLESRVGLVLGLGAEWMLLWEDDHSAGGTRLYDPEQDRESTIERVRRGLNLSGPALAISAACASGNHALELGRSWLRLGLVDYCVAGACDLAVSPIGLATFGNLRASRGGTPNQSRHRGHLTGTATDLCWAKAGSSSCWNDQAMRAALGQRLRGGCRLRLEQRCPPPRDPQPRPGPGRRRHAAGAGRRAHRSRAGRSRQRTRDEHAGRRCRRSGGPSSGAGR